MVDLEPSGVYSQAGKHSAANCAKVFSIVGGTFANGPFELGLEYLMEGGECGHIQTEKADERVGGRMAWGSQLIIRTI